MGHWLNPCPESHYDKNDTRHAPFLQNRYAKDMTDATARHTMGVMRELAAMGRDEDRVKSVFRSSLPEKRESIVRNLWSIMGPGSEVGQPRDLSDEELRLMTIMMCQGDWPPEMVAGAERHKWSNE
jgi:hypothetical protein